MRQLATAIAFLVLSACAPAAPSATPAAVLGVGDAAPDFTLPAADGRRVTLAEYRDKSSVLLYFHMAYG